MSPSAVVLKLNRPRQTRGTWRHALESAWSAWERTVCSAEGRLEPTTSGLVRCLSALVPKCGQKESKRTGGEAETSVYILIKENWTLLHQGLVPLPSHETSKHIDNLGASIRVPCLLRSFSSQRWQITVHTLCLIGNLPERQEANWFEWHKTKTTLTSGMCSVPQSYRTYATLEVTEAVLSLCGSSRVSQEQGWSSEDGKGALCSPPVV